MKYPKTDEERAMYRDLKAWEAEPGNKKYEGVFYVWLIFGLVVLLPLFNSLAGWMG